ncbi:hypothetical protein FAI40_04210 [Acetobacteraceae bacterium]|nr:hypothetical protein FAI40_04210 [Acetobacteraceae bacterium]
MKALVFNEFGNPETVLEDRDASLRPLQKDEVRIRMLLAPIHNHHLWYIKGQYGIKPRLPAVPGDEALGIIEEVGSAIVGLKKGQKVIACKMWGAWAEEFIAKGGDVVPVPEGVPDEIAAQLLSMPLSAMMLLGATKAKAGEWVIQNASNGAVGKVLAPIGKSRGIHVLSLVRSQKAKREMLEAKIEPVVSTDEVDWKDQVVRITGGKAVAGVDSVGGQAGGEMLSLLGKGGVLISFGAMSGEAIQIDPSDLIFRNKKIRGFWATQAAKEIPSEAKLKMLGNLAKSIFAGEMNPKDAGGLNLERLSKGFAIRKIAALVKAGKIQLPVAGTYPLADYKEALKASEEAGRKGKILFRP